MLHKSIIFTLMAFTLAGCLNHEKIATHVVGGVALHLVKEAID